MDNFSYIGEGCLIKPSLQPQSQHNIIAIGKYTYVGNKSIIKAIWIGDCVRINKNVIIDNNVIIEDNIIIEENSFIPEGSWLCKNSIFGGIPAQYKG